MDPSVLIQHLLKFWYFIPLLLLLAILPSRWFKGHLGEFIVNVSARLFLDKDYALRAGESSSSTAFVVGIRAWY